MPELPEVESFGQYVNATSLHKDIAAVKMIVPKMLEGTSLGQLQKTLNGSRITGTFRHGKFLFLILSNGKKLMLHFGLTGDLVYVPRGEDGPGKFVLQLYFSDDTSLFLTDTRKFGKVALVEDIAAFLAKRKYGKDALEISEEEFISQLKKKRVAIKTVLMDQRAIAGIGNEFSDEILFQSRVHPATVSAALSSGQLKRIFRHLKSILKESVHHKAERDKLHHFFFLENRKPGLSCPRCGGRTAFQTIGGRSSYFCPACQKKSIKKAGVNRLKS